ncbi:MAG: HAD-IC family P-type ATPase [Candidatus Absconditabacterales bacterium]|nr:HAD-IC family P-type ATPase [Candidatus Absconditabacterales bacterium]
MHRTSSPHAIDLASCYAQFKSSEIGLSTHDAQQRLKVYGPNELPRDQGIHPIIMFLHQFHNPLVYILIIIGLGSAWMGKRIDAIVIAGVVCTNALIGAIQEYKAQRSINALSSLVVPIAKVVRQGQLLQIPARDLVPGDIIVMEEGDSIPADARLISVKNFSTIEASLTGETASINKSIEQLKESTGLADRSNMVWMGTFVARGTARALVTATGIHTTIGMIAKTMNSIQTSESNFERKIHGLTKNIALLALGASLLTAGIGWIKGFDRIELISLSIASLISGIPEGLPAILTLVLAIGAKAMSDQRAIVRTLTATETLGAVSVICTDKTGTLTYNTMTVKHIRLPDIPHIYVRGAGRSSTGGCEQDGKAIKRDHIPRHSSLIHACALATTAVVNNEGDEYTIIGDPTEAALVVLANKAHVNKQSLASTHTMLDDMPFNSDLKMRATLVRLSDNSRILYVIGASEIVWGRATQVHGENIRDKNSSDQSFFADHIQQGTSEAMRLLGIAYKKINTDTIDEADLHDLVWMGMVGILDPIRAEVPDAIAQCRQAGMRVIMLTGDHKQTAIAIGKRIGLIDEEHPTAYTEEELAHLPPEDFNELLKHCNIFARCTPQRKLLILELLQSQGHIVAMTGDGVNDAPALKKAHVGIAMGKIGTDVAREAAQIVLADDNFATIVSAIKHGRIIYNNVRKSANLALNRIIAGVGCIGGVMLLGDTMPFIGIQLLWLNLVTETITGIGLAFEGSEGNELQGKPVMLDAGLISRETLPFILRNALLMIILTTGTYRYYTQYTDVSAAYATTLAFVVLYLTQFANLLNLRSFTQSLFRLGLWSNPVIIIGIIGSIALQALAIYRPVLQSALQFTAISATDLARMVVIASGVWIGGELYKLIRST